MRWRSMVYDDGRGRMLYATGQFTQLGDTDARSIARWDGTQWSALDSGLTHSGGTYASAGYSLAVLDDGTGPALYVGGRFEQAGGAPARNVAKWDGQNFHALGDGISNGYGILTVLDDGEQRVLYAAGDGLYRWDGTTWHRAPSEPEGSISSLVSFDDGHGPALWCGGSFLTAGGKPSVNIARWGCAANWLPGDLNCDGTSDRRDIDPFVQALSDAGKYETIYPDCLLQNADLNGNGSVGFDDINPYVEMLLGSGR